MTHTGTIELHRTTVRSALIHGSVAGICALTFLASHSAAQQCPELRRMRLAAPTFETPGTFASVTSAVTLANGNTLVSDAASHAIWLISAKTHAITPVGHRGRGPLEYETPRRIVRAPRGQWLIEDAGLRRVMQLDPTGRIIATTVPEAESSSYHRLMAIDSSGGIYSETRLTHAPTADSTKAPRDSLMMLRILGADTDTLGLLALPERVAVTVTREGEKGTVWFDRPYSRKELWTVTGGGTIVALHDEPARIEWTDGAFTTRPIECLVPEPVKVDAADLVDSPNADVHPQDLHPPATKAPFSAMTVNPSGDAWLRMSVAATARSVNYLVVPRTSTIACLVLVPAYVRVVNVEKKQLLGATTHEDGRESLGVYPVPECR